MDVHRRSMCFKRRAGEPDIEAASLHDYYLKKGALNTHLRGSPEIHPQSLQNPLIKEYASDHIRDPIIV